MCDNAAPQRVVSVTELPSHLRYSARHSLRYRVPLYFSALIAGILLTFVWVAYTQVERALLDRGRQRMETTADHVAYFLDRQAVGQQIRQLSSDEILSNYLQSPDAATRAAAQTRLEDFSGTGPRRAELWNTAGERLLEFSVPAPAGSRHAGKTLPPRARPSSSGIKGFDRYGDLVVSDTVAEIRRDGQPLGFLVTTGALRVVPPDIVSRLVGRDAAVLIGTRDSAVWTDLAGPAAAPPIDLREDGFREYRGPDGRRRLGVLKAIPGSPWVAWTEMPRDVFTAYADRFLVLVTPFAVVFLIASLLLARAISGRMTGPLTELSAAAGRVATGDYSERVPVRGRDEIGRVAEAFNAMTAEISRSQQQLEARVAERTSELGLARGEADRANRAKNEFLSLMSHDLRTPLNAIIGFAELLESDGLNADQREHIEHILTAARHLLVIISDVLDVTRIESGRLAMSLEPVGVREIALRNLDLLKPIAAERHVTMRVEGIQAGAAVLADRHRLGQVLINLIANAVIYNLQGGTVIVRGERVPGARFRISVVDTGAGIPAGKLDRLFRPFERLGAEQTATEGTGLGLALSKALVEVMGGTIGVTSVVDQGSTFWIELAEADPSQKIVPIEPVKTGDIPPADRGCVLYIEDNRSNVRLLERIIARRPGVVLRHAPTGETGVSAAGELRPQLVLLDMHLPDFGGEEVLRRLWADPVTRPIPVIVVTADATPGLGRRLQDEGAAGYLTKPLSVNEVLRTIDETLGRPGNGQP